MKGLALIFVTAALLTWPAVGDEMHFKYGSIIVECSRPNHDDKGVGDNYRVVIGAGTSVRCDEAGHIMLYSPISRALPDASL
jgi:hypothetical protein